ncbi:MAG TPA: RidA family protein [Paenirhodobacter sp.]
MATLPFSKVRRIGNTFYLSGEIGFNADGSLPDDIAAQTRNCLDRIRETLRGEGMDMANVISCLCHLTDKTDFAAFNAAYAPYFVDPLPTRTTVESGLMAPAKLEITVIAAV